MAKNNPKDDINQKLDTIIKLLQHELAIQLYRNGVTQEDIRKHLHVAKAVVVKMVKGVKKEKLNIN